MSIGRHLVRLLARARRLGITRTSHQVRWRDGVIVLKGSDGQRLVVDVAAGTVALDIEEDGWRTLASSTAGDLEVLAPEVGIPTMAP